MFWYRKRSFSSTQDDCDLESTRDSVLSGNSQIYSDICDPDLMIIDFEYCAYNYRGFDLANHFLEWTIDYRCNEYPFFYHKRDHYPTVEQQVSVDKLYNDRHFVEVTFKSPSIPGTLYYQLPDGISFSNRWLSSVGCRN